MDVLPISMNGLEGDLLLVLLMILAADGLPNPVDLAVGIPSTVDGVFANGFDFRLCNNLDKFSSNGSEEEEDPSVGSDDLEMSESSSDFGGDGGTWLKNDPVISSFVVSSSSSPSVSLLEDDDNDTSL